MEMENKSEDKHQYLGSQLFGDWESLEHRWVLKVLSMRSHSELTQEPRSSDEKWGLSRSRLWR